MGRCGCREGDGFYNIEHEVETCKPLYRLGSNCFPLQDIEQVGNRAVTFSQLKKVDIFVII